MLGIRGSEGMTLGMFVVDAYTTWLHSNRPRTAATRSRSCTGISGLVYPEPLTAITIKRIESWKATVQMSLRYAHLAPDKRREAVAKLNEKPILALTLRPISRSLA